jgi:cytosine permease
VKTGGLVGIVLAILVTAGFAILIVAGVYGSPELTARAVASNAGMNAFRMIPVVLGDDLAKWLMFALALAAFPSACFSAFIAANSFKTTLPQVNPFISVGIGAAVSIVLAVSGLAGDAAWVFGIIGASFGPICGAMMVDYLLAGGTWTGPRAGFNPAGWIAWALGFIVGILPNLGVAVPAAPVAAFIVGALVYFLCAKAGLRSQVVPLPVAR